MTVLVTPAELSGRLAEVSLLDVRWQLGRTDGAACFAAGHLPGAAYVDLDADLADPPGSGEGGRHPLPDPDRFGRAMRRCGISGTRPVVVYDDAAGRAAARAWWLLRHHGHPDVRVLDGGWTAWRAAGGDVETGTPSVAAGDFESSAGALPLVSAGEAAETARQGVLLDARAPERYRGEQEPVDPVAGHVPGALNVPTDLNLVSEGPDRGRFRPLAELAEVYAPAVAAARAGRPVAVYCGSGVTAAHDLLALEMLGVTAGLYAGSWSAWVTDPSRPVARG